jgi:olefin beta-lactone synthetase
LAGPELASAVRGSVTLPLAAILVVPTLPTDIRHNSKINRTALAAWATGILAGGRVVRP